jgi:hypothetical protein
MNAIHRSAFRSRRPWAISLLEVILALSVLITAFGVIIALFIRSSSAIVQVERKAMGIVFAETVLDDIESWARKSTNFTGSWATWSNYTIDEFPDFEARAVVTTPAVFRPCRALEVPKPASEQATMMETFRDLELTVYFKSIKQFSMHTRLYAPDRGGDKVEVTIISGGSPLSGYATADLEAVLLDSAGVAIPDVTFQWSVEPNGGNGTIRRHSPERYQATLVNEYLLLSGVARPVPGECRVKAVCRYRGLEYSGLSTVIEMLP